MNLLLVTLLDNDNNKDRADKVIINEDHVAIVEKWHDSVMVTMSIGEKLVCTSPTYEEWLHDVLKRKF